MNRSIRSWTPGVCAAVMLAMLSQTRADGPPLTKLEVFPPAMTLTGAKSEAYVAVTGIYADGTIRDLTTTATMAIDNPAVATVAKGVVKPLADGAANIVITSGETKAQIPLQVVQASSVLPRSFEYDCLTALTKQSCNSGACHGSPSGKGGFRLSLRAFDPVLDQLTLIREDLGRRTNPMEPEKSLLLQKPLMKVPHGGGLKLHTHDPAYQMLTEWIAQGCKPDPAGAPKCVGIEVYPPTGRMLIHPATTQQLVVRGKFSDGSVRDITAIACYSSSDVDVATVSDFGAVNARDRGETAVVVRYAEFVETCFLTFVKDIPGYTWEATTQKNYIDELVDVKLKQLQFRPSGICNDEEFLRRVHLDVIGTLPTVERTAAFLADNSPDKRAKLIDELFERPEYASFWALKWGDLLRLTTTQIGNEGTFKYHRWLVDSIRKNKPYDQFAKELLTAQGSTLQNPPAYFYRTAPDVNECVETVSQVFLGSRLQCAKCHNHPFERWTQDNYYGLAAFFNRVQRKKAGRPDETLVYMAREGEVTQPRTSKQMKPWLPYQGDIDPPAESDRRQPFADWLTKKDNPFFGKVEVNRMWSQLFGRGLVDPIDDFRDSNPPSNAPLLERLAKDFAESGYDRRHMLKLMLNSRTYQTDYRPNQFNETDTKYNSHYAPRLLSAEQLLDAICSVTALPEQFGGLPAGSKAIQIPAPDMVKNEFLKAFGQPERSTVCACERSSDSNLGMAIQFFNGPLIHGKLRSPENRFRKLMASGKPNAEIIDELYMAAVCRKPTDKERETAMNHIASKPDPVAAMEDVCWAILNTNEFLFQH